MIPTEILRRVGRKAQQLLRPTGPVTPPAEPVHAKPATNPEHVPAHAAPAAHGTAAPAVTPAVFDSYTAPGELESLGVLLMPLAEYHGRELGAVADALVAMGHRCTFLVEDTLVEMVDRHLGDHPRILAARNYDRFALGHFDAFVAMNDWGEPSRAIYHLARVRSVPSFAKVEGVQDFTDVDTGRIRLPYMAADHVLVQGSNDIAALDRKHLHIVGNSNLETAWNEGPASVDRNGEVVINSNFTYGVLTDARDEYLKQSIEAVLAAGLEPVISQHPADRALPGDVVQYRTDRSMSSMLPAVEAIVTRFSTVPFEAIAYGTPFVYFNPHYEKVPTFSSPDPAFDHVHTVDELTKALQFSIENRSSYRTVAEPYFRAQIDIADSPSAARTAKAIASVVYS